MRFQFSVSFLVFEFTLHSMIRVHSELRYIHHALLCLVMHREGGRVFLWSFILSRGDVDCATEYDGDDPCYSKVFNHISMRHYV